MCACRPLARMDLDDLLALRRSTLYPEHQSRVAEPTGPVDAPSALPPCCSHLQSVRDVATPPAGPRCSYYRHACPIPADLPSFTSLEVRTI
jgi:hypothetical protein